MESNGLVVIYNNDINEGELDGLSTVRKFRTIQMSVFRNFRTTESDGKIYNVKHYHQDMIIVI